MSNILRVDMSVVHVTSQIAPFLHHPAANSDSATEVRQGVRPTGDGDMESVRRRRVYGDGDIIIGSITQIVVSGALQGFHTMSPHVILVLHLHGVSDTPASRSANELSIVGMDGDGTASTLPRVSVPLKGVVLLTSTQPAKGLTHSAHDVDGRRNKKARVNMFNRRQACTGNRSHSHSLDL